MAQRSRPTLAAVPKGTEIRKSDVALDRVARKPKYGAT
jgi:hypothetical protein